MFKGVSLFFKAMEGFNCFFDETNRQSRTLTFYSEKGIYLRYYQELMNKILSRSDLDICYLTADINDPVFQLNDKRIKPFYINNYDASLFPRLDSKVVVMTLPDLNQFYIKKTTNKSVNHVYAFHAIGSTHLQYNFGAFDHYDTIFCVGPHHEAELRKTESLYQLQPKTLVKYGYPYLEQVYRDHQAFLKRNPKAEKTGKTVLIAPTWGKNCILETCIQDLVGALRKTEYDVFIRPHPEFVKRRKKIVAKIEKLLKGIDNIKLEQDLVSGINVHNADILITDWSGIAFEFAFGTERPVLFIDTPLKIDNPKYQKLSIEPLELLIRNQIGRSVKITEINGIVNFMNSFIDNYDNYRDKIIEFRNQYIYNWLHSSEVGADYIIKLCKS